MTHRRQIHRSLGALALAWLTALLIPATCRGQGYTITTVAGNGSVGYSGDGGLATNAELSSPVGVALDTAGNLYIADQFNYVIRKVSPNGTISTVAGRGGFSYQECSAAGCPGDGGPATSASLGSPMGVALDTAGNLYIADDGYGCVRKVTPNGTITTVAGNGGYPYSGDGGPATSAAFVVAGIAVDATGNIYIAGAGTSRVRRVAPNGIVTTIAGDGSSGVSSNMGDGGPATSATLPDPTAVAVDTVGNLYIADGNNRIRKVTPAGIISTVAGGGSPYSPAFGDGGPATSAWIDPRGVAVDSSGNLYIADDYLVRMVSTGGTISTIAGGGNGGYTGDGGPATAAELGFPSGIAIDGRGRIYFSDTSSSVVRMLTPVASTTPPSVKSGGIVTASAFGAFPSVAPGSWIEIYGSNLAADSRSWTGADFTGVNAPTSLDGTKVTIGGQPAFIDYISPTQVNAQVPSNVATGSQPVIVTSAAGASTASTIAVNQQEPGLLAPSSFLVGGKQYVAALFSDGATFVLPPGAVAGVPSRRAQPGDTITLYGVGFGPVTPNTPAGQVVQQTNTLTGVLHVLFGQTQAVIGYDGLAPNAVGLYQFNVVVPNVAASDTVPLTFTLGGVAGTQTLYIAVQN